MMSLVHKAPNYPLHTDAVLAHPEIWGHHTGKRNPDTSGGLTANAVLSNGVKKVLPKTDIIIGAHFAPFSVGLIS